MTKRLLLRAALTLATTYLLACIVCGILLAELSVHLHKLPVDQAAAYLPQAQLEDVSITAADGAILKAWYAQPPKPNGQSVIILHGITANRVSSTGFAAPFLAHGYSVLVPDSRAHGESGGAIATYGILERYDVKQWVDFLRSRAPGCTYLLGESMGAAIGLQASAVTPRLCAVAVEDPYATFREISYVRLGRGTHTGIIFWQTLGRPVLEAAILYTRLRYGFWLTSADDQAAVQKTTTPTLLIAGTADQNIPMRHAEELERACSSHCTLWIVPGADHGGASTVAYADFYQRILNWFASHDSR